MARTVEYIHYPNDVRMTKDPDARGYWRVRWPANGDGKPGDRRFADRALAEAFCFELSRVAERKVTGAATKPDTTVAELCEMWRDPDAHDRPLSPTYLRSAVCWQDKYVIPAIGHVRTGDWGPEHSRQVLEAGKQNGLAPSSLNRLRRDLSSLAATGRQLGCLAVGQDPLEGVKTPNHRQELDLADLPTRADIARLGTALAEHTGQAWRKAQVQMLALTGLRIGELLGLTRDDIDLERRTIRVERQLLTVPSGTIMAPPKYGSVRTVPLAKGLAAAIEHDLPHRVLPQPWEGARGYPDGEGVPLFPSARGGFERYSTFKNQRWNPAASRAGWPRNPSGRGFRWTPHTLRHWFCTTALATPPEGFGLEVADVQRLAGHSSPELTWKVYVQSRPGRIDRAAAALDSMEMN